MGTKVTKIPVSERALIQRINRKLHADDEMLKTSRSERMEQDCGRYYAINFRINGVTRKHIDLEDLGRDLGVLRDYERMVSE